DRGDRDQPAADPDVPLHHERARQVRLRDPQPDDRRLRQHEGDQDPEAVERRQRDHLLPVVERADDDEPDREQADAEDRGGRVEHAPAGAAEHRRELVVLAHRRGQAAAAREARRDREHEDRAGGGADGNAEDAAVATAAYTMTTVNTDERTLSGTERSGSFASAATLLTFSRPV